MKDFTRTDEEIKILSSRVSYLTYFVVFAFLIIISRFWYLQIYRGLDLRQYSENNRLKKQNIEAPRGWILTRDKTILTNNYYQLSLTITPQYIKDIYKVSEAVSEIISLPQAEIIQQIKKSRRGNGQFYPFVIKKQLDLDQVYHLNLLKLSFNELNIRQKIARYYPFKDSASQLLGYIGEISKKEIQQINSKGLLKKKLRAGDFIGKDGVERFWEKELRGEDGVSFIEVDAHSRNTITSPTQLWNLQNQEPKSGHHIVLTIDKDIQRAAIKAFNRKDRIGPRKGAIIAMKSNGEILAWVSSPSFDPNTFSQTISNEYWSELRADIDKPMLNRVIQNHYPPGSIIKPFYALAALDKNIIDETTLINSPSKIRFGRRFFHDHQRTDYGKITLFDAIERSSNTFFYQLGMRMPFDEVAPYLKLFGFGKSTNIELNGEIPGLIPTQKWKRDHLNKNWQKGENLVHAIGQGYTLITPIQLALAFNAIATEGLLMKPLIVQRIINSDNQDIHNFQPQVLRDLSETIDKKHFKTIKQALVRVIHGKKGTARWWKIKNREMAGKTGTIQVQSFNPEALYQNCNKKPIQERHHGWFASFSPIEKPEITVVVLTENSCSGSSGSAPIARDIIRAYFKKYSTPLTASSRLAQ